MARFKENNHEPSRSLSLDLVWLRCSESVTTAGISQALDGQTRVHVGLDAPERRPSCVVLCADTTKGLANSVKQVQEQYPGVPVLIFGLRAELALVRAAFGAGSQGFIHASMGPSQVARALAVAATGESVAPRGLLLQLVAQEGPVALDKLSARQRQVLDLVAEGLSNAEIAQQLYLSESTIKQHLRSAYKLLGVKNRIEATRLVRNGY